MPGECPSSPNGRHNWVSNGPHQLKCTYCGQSQVVYFLGASVALDVSAARYGVGHDHR